MLNNDPQRRSRSYYGNREEPEQNSKQRRSYYARSSVDREPLGSASRRKPQKGSSRDSYSSSSFYTRSASSGNKDRSSNRDRTAVIHSQRNRAASSNGKSNSKKHSDGYRDKQSNNRSSRQQNRRINSNNINRNQKNSNHDHNQDRVYTKNVSNRHDQGRSVKSKGNNTFFDVVVLVLSYIARFFKTLALLIARFFKWLWFKSHAAAAIVGIIAVLFIVASIDNIAMSNKIYDGIKVGYVDVSGMTISQAEEAIEDAYAAKLETTQLFIFASEEAMNETDIDMVKAEQDATSEQLSVEQAQENKLLWIENAETLGATLPAYELAESAYQVGRNGAIFDRLSAKLSNYTIEPYAEYRSLSLEKLMNDIDKTIGDPVVQYGIQVEEGYATVTEGHDGYMVDQDKFKTTLNDSFFISEDNDIRIVAQVEYVPLVINEEIAQKSADAVNEAIADGASFAYEGQSAFASASELGSWIATKESKRGNDWYLRPYIDEEKTIRFLTNSMNMKGTDAQIAVNFIVEEDGVKVDPTTDITIPNVGGAIESLDEALFRNFDDIGQFKLQGSQFDIPISVQTNSDILSLEEALAFGVVSNFSSFTTEFVGNNATENRTYNIHKAADLINNSIVPADGGMWSFNETAGDCNAEAGFKDANVVSGDEMVQEAGGGVCQVATTIFNSVYNAGLPIKERHNHSIVSASYPAGKDAAVAYPTLDFVWQNNTISEILVTTSYTANSITVNLIGVDPKLTVKTDTGEWQEGEKYKIKYEIDEYMKPNQSYRKTLGFDGSSITIVRTVTDESGEVVEQNTFYSLYQPMNEIIVVGKDSDMDEIRSKYEKKDDSSTDSKN